MNALIVQQPNGLFALWSPEMTHFLLLNATSEEMLEYQAERKERQLGHGQVHEIDSCFQIGMSWEQCLSLIDDVHGRGSRDEIMAGLAA